MVCTPEGDIPLPKASGLPLPIGAQIMLYLSLKHALTLIRLIVNNVQKIIEIMIYHIHILKHFIA